MVFGINPLTGERDERFIGTANHVDLATCCEAGIATGDLNSELLWACNTATKLEFVDVDEVDDNNEKSCLLTIMALDNLDTPKFPLI